MLPARRSPNPSTPGPAGFDPFAELDSLNQRLSRYLDHWSQFPSLLDGHGFGFTPLADVEETDDAYLVEVELPGMKRSDIDVTLAGADPDAEVSAGYDDGVLTIRVPKPEADRARRIPVT